jgi:hypothetical protein
MAQPLHRRHRNRLVRQLAASPYRLFGQMRIAVVALAFAVCVTAASAATVVGTPGDDRLVGTAGADVLEGRAGRDRLLGLAGSDVLDGGAGRDVVDAGPGSDRVAVQYDGARDAVRCGAGADLVNADPLDLVAGDCELVGRRLSRDPYTNPDSRHETQVEPDSFTVGRTTVATFQVGRRFDGAATNIGFAVTTDDGRTWRSGLLPGLTVASVPAGPHARASDPVVAYDAAAGVWLISTLALDPPATRLTISRSTDGVTWSAPVIAAEAVAASGIAFDKNWVACDNGAASPFRGHCYLAYTDTLRDDRIAVLTSADGGVTWSTPSGIPVTGAVGAFPVIRPNGDVVVVFNWGRRLGASVSADGGATFGAASTISDLQVRNARGLRLFPLPSADVDSTGRVWVAWHDCRFSGGCATNSAVVAISADGRAWSSPTAVTSGRNAMLPAVGAHPRTGRVAVAYHVVRPGGGVDVELVEVGPDRRRLTPPRRLSAETMRPEWMPDTVSGRMLADYISVHYAGGRPLVVWVLASEPVGASLRQAVFATRG